MLVGKLVGKLVTVRKKFKKHRPASYQNVGDALPTVTQTNNLLDLFDPRTALGLLNSRGLKNSTALLVEDGLNADPCERGRPCLVLVGAAKGVYNSKNILAYQPFFAVASPGETMDFSSFTVIDDEALNAALVRRRMNNELSFPPNFERLVLGCIDADCCKT